MIKTPYRVVSLTLFLTLLLLGGCAQEQRATRPEDNTPVVIKPPGTPNEYLLAVGELEPSFGGFFVADAQLNIYLLNADTATQAEKKRVLRSLARVYGEDFAPLSTTPKFLKGDYSMVDLYSWYSRFGEVWSIEGVSTTDLDEARNRLAVGVVDEAVKPEVQQVLGQLEIPLEAVILEVEGYACPGIGWYAIIAEVRDANGQPAARGARVTITKSGYEATQTGSDPPAHCRRR